MKLLVVGDLIEWSGCYYADTAETSTSIENDRVFLNSLKQVGIVHAIDETSFCVCDGTGFFRILRRDVEAGAAKFSVLSRAIVKHKDA